MYRLNEEQSSDKAVCKNVVVRSFRFQYFSTKIVQMLVLFFCIAYSVADAQTILSV